MCGYYVQAITDFLIQELPAPFQFAPMEPAQDAAAFCKVGMKKELDAVD
jgi:hypothetical protein